MWMQRIAAGALVCLIGACGSERRPTETNTTPRDAGVANAKDAGTVRDAGPRDAGPPPRDAGVPYDAGPIPNAPDCAAPTVTSLCADQAIVRIVARLGDDMPSDSGRFRLVLNHLRLGRGEFGGIYHTNADGPEVVTISRTSWTELHFDMCAGGEMWSEDNCEYSLYGYLDRNDDGELNIGEPAGRLTLDLSCFETQAACHEMVLDCLDGMLCTTFTADQQCQCSGQTCPEYVGHIVTCQ